MPGQKLVCIIEKMKANGKRIVHRLNEIYECGKKPDGTHSRVAFTSEDRKGREVFCRYCEELGLKPVQDQGGNLIVRMDGKKKDAPAIIIGSHMDTVLDGGKYDGVYGCVGGLEVLEILAEEKIKPNHPIEVIVFADEEGIRFGSGMFGSNAFCGKICQDVDPDETDIFGIKREEVMREAGVDLQQIAKAKRASESVLGTLELHVEQGGSLDQMGIPVGIVTSIAGVKRYSVVLGGEANHSGSTRMCDRHDALVAAGKMIGILPDIVQKYGDSFTVGTVGQISVEPGAVNIIPGRCEFLLEFRDQSEETMERLAEIFRKTLSHVCEQRDIRMSMKLISDHEPGKMNSEIQRITREACEKLEIPYTSIPSGAFHDSLLLTQRFPAGMIFVPSEGGISHSPREFTREEDLAAGVEILLHTVLMLDEKEGIENESV